MSYSKVQFIAYRIYTCPAHGPDRYVGLNDETDDVHQRVKLMAEAIGNAAKCAEVDPSPDVLKVFIAPEFYFHSMWGAYTSLKYFSGEGAARDPDSIVGALADVVQDEAWKDWLFVFGTATVEAAPFTASDYLDQRPGNILLTLWYSLKRLAELYGRKAVLNVSLVQKGGFANEDQRTSKAIVVVKEYKSPIDYLKRQQNVVGLTDDNVAHFPAVGPGTYALEVNTPGRGSGFNGGSIFMLDNITFGLEVCLDHAKQRLIRAKPDSGDFFVQIQLIPSGGIIIQPTSVAALHGGLVCNVDGYYDKTTTKTSPSQYGFHAQLYKVTSVSTPANLHDMDEVPRAVTVAAHADLDEVKKVFWLPPSNDVNDDKTWKPDLVVFSAVDIPDPVQASFA